MGYEQLPFVDEHAISVQAPTDAVWLALTDLLDRSFSGAGHERIAKLLGSDSTRSSRWAELAPGSALPGFRIDVAAAPQLLALRGKHRFADYALTFRLEEAGDGCRCVAETRAAFPGWLGQLYRLAVIGSGGHRLVARRMLGAIKRAAERGT